MYIYVLPHFSFFLSLFCVCWRVAASTGGRTIKNVDWIDDTVHICGVSMWLGIFAELDGWRSAKSFFPTAKHASSLRRAWISGSHQLMRSLIQAYLNFMGSDNYACLESYGVWAIDSMTLVFGSYQVMGRFLNVNVAVLFVATLGPGLHPLLGKHRHIAAQKTNMIQVI